MNVGPSHDGRIMPIFEERLLQMGELSNSINHVRSIVCQVA